MSTATKMSFGPTTPNKLSQSTEAMYVPSHLFPTSANMALHQEDTYLSLNPQRNVAPMSMGPQNQPYTAQAPKPSTDNDTPFKYFVSPNTPYKSVPVTPKEGKSPSSELPPAKSVYDVVGTRHDITFSADTSMGEADLSTGGMGGFGMGGIGGGSGGVGMTEADVWGPNRIDWDSDAMARSGLVTSPGAARTPYVSPMLPVRPYTIPQSPPFGKSSVVETSVRPVAQSEEIWLTVFGFPPTQSASNIVLKHFQELDDVVQYEQPIGVNWLHLCYRLRQHAERAMAKNGKLIGEHMIGVTPRSDTTHLPAATHTVIAKDANKLYDRNALLLPPKEQSWLKSVLSFTFG